MMFRKFINTQPSRNSSENLIYISALLVRVFIVIILVEVLYFLTAYIHIFEPTLVYSELFKIITGGLIIIGLVYTIFTFEFTQVKNIRDSRQLRASLTYQAIGEWQKESYVSYQKTISEMEQTELFKLRLTDISKFVKELESNQNFEYRKAIFVLLNFFEQVSTALKQRLMDEEYLKSFYKDIFEVYYDDYIQYIQQRRINKNRQTIWIEFTNLAESWKN